MKAAFLTLPALALASALPIQAQTKSPFVETTTLTFSWPMSVTTVGEALTDGPPLPEEVIYDPEKIPTGFDRYTYVATPSIYNGTTSGNPYRAGANRQLIHMMLQRLSRNGLVSRDYNESSWQFIAVREAPANVYEMATNPYRVFLSAGGRSSIEVAEFDQEPVIDDPVPDGISYIDSTPQSFITTIDTGITITLGQYNGNYTESKWSDTNWVRSASGTVATAFHIDFGALFYDDPPGGNATRNPYNYHLKRNVWTAVASGFINYGIRTIPGPLPTFLASNSTGTATGWFEHGHDEYRWNDTAKVYQLVPGSAYSVAGIAPLKVTLSPIQYQKRTLFELDIPATPTMRFAQNASLAYSAGVVSGGLQIFWSDFSSNETGFSLQRRDGENGEWTEIIRPDRNSNSIFDGDAPADTTCYYRIASFNGAGMSEYSNEISMLMLPRPTNLQGEGVSDTEIVLTWEDNSTLETGYQLQRLVRAAEGGRPEVWQTIANLDPDVVTYTDTGLKAKTDYTYRIRTVYTDTTTTPPTTILSAWSNVAVISTGDAPAPAP